MGIDVANLTRDKARGLINQFALKDLAKALGLVFAGGATARGVVGIAGNMKRNIQRKKERDEMSKPRNELIFPVKSAENPGQQVPRPAWYAPLAYGGGALAGIGGWGAMGAVLKNFRKQKQQEELAKAKQEFEDALAGERQLKFSCDLHELAEAYARGEYTPEKQAGISGVVNSIPALMLGLALASGGTGLAAGWKLGGSNPNKRKIDAYLEASRRRRAAKPISLVAKTRPITDTEDNDSEDYAKQASLGKVLRYGASALGGALGTSLLATKTPIGRWWIGQRTNDLMQDPKFIESQADKFLNNPKVMDHIYQRMMPMITSRMEANNPFMGRLMATALRPRRMTNDVYA